MRVKGGSSRKKQTLLVACEHDNLIELQTANKRKNDGKILQKRGRCVLRNSKSRRGLDIRGKHAAPVLLVPFTDAHEQTCNLPSVEVCCQKAVKGIEREGLEG